MTNLIEILAGARVFDLAQPYFVGMPHHPSHPSSFGNLTRPEARTRGWKRRP